MNWRKRAVGLNSVESNNIQHLRKFQKDCISSLNFIASSVVRFVHIISILSKMNEVLLYFILNIVTPGVTLKDKEDRNNSRFQISTFAVFFRKSQILSSTFNQMLTSNPKFYFYNSVEISKGHHWILLLPLVEIWSRYQVRKSLYYKMG